MVHRTHFLKIATISMSFVILIFGAYVNSYSANYYVDNAANGANNGYSWNDAWESFADIHWSNVKPGDTVYISGGAISKTYHETIDLSSTVDGTPGNEITITVGIDAGHTGQVVIDGDSRRRCIRLDGNDYVIIGGNAHNYIKVIDSIERVVYVTNSHHWVVQYVEAPNYSQRAVVFVQKKNSNFTISHIKGHNSSYSSKQTDFIVVQTGGDYTVTDYVIEHIDWRDDNTNPSPHTDCMQLGTTNYPTNNGTLRYNYCEQNNNKRANAQGIFVENFTGTWLVYNNLLNYNTGVPLKFKSSNRGGKVNVYNNTIIKRGSSDRNMALVGGAGSKVKNNIFYRADSQNPALNFYDTLSNPSNQVDYNIYYVNGKSSPIVRYHGSKSWSTWTSAPYNAEAHGYLIDPSLDADWKPDSIKDPLVDAGVNLSGIFSDDKDGVSRPQGSSWDIGSYEFGEGSGGKSEKPAPPKNLRIVSN